MTAREDLVMDPIIRVRFVLSVPMCLVWTETGTVGVVNKVQASHWLKILLTAAAFMGIAYFLWLGHKPKNEVLELCQFLADHSSNSETIYRDCIKGQKSDASDNMMLNLIDVDSN